MTSLSRFSSSSSPSGSSSKGKGDKNSVNFGSPFPEAILNTPYQYLLNVPGEYDIYLDSSGYHWYIMVRYNVEGSDFPYVSFEITCDKLHKGDLIPTMRVLEENDSDTEIVTGVGQAIGFGLGVVAGPAGMFFTAAVAAVAAGGLRGVMLSMSGTKLKKVGTMKTTIMKLCETAEAVRVGMGKYNLFSNNCQHFCNNLLEKLKLPTTPTTVGHRTTGVEGSFDDIDQIFKVVPHKKGDESDGDMKG